MQCEPQIFSEWPDIHFLTFSADFKAYFKSCFHLKAFQSSQLEINFPSWSIAAVHVFNMHQNIYYKFSYCLTKIFGFIMGLPKFQFSMQFFRLFYWIIVLSLFYRFNVFFTFTNRYFILAFSIAFKFWYDYVWVFVSL